MEYNGICNKLASLFVIMDSNEKDDNLLQILFKYNNYSFLICFIFSLLYVFKLNEMCDLVIFFPRQSKKNLLFKD